MPKTNKSNPSARGRELSGSAGGPVAPLWRQRRFVLGIAVALLLMLTFILSGPSFPSVLYRLLTDVPLLILWLGAAFGYGAFLPLPAGAERAAERGQPRNEALLHLITALGLGLGILSLATLVFGVVGLITPLTTWLLILLGSTLAIVRVTGIVKRRTQTSALREPVQLMSYLWLALIPLASMVLISAFVPPGILWGDEPHGYDVLEYHLQLPREWYEAHRITTNTHNVFSYMPLAVETHYLLAMEMRGGPWAGMYLAQLMHVAFCAMTAFAVYAIARAQDSPAAVLAGVAIAATPWLALLGPVAYNEGGLLLYGTLAIGWALRGLRNDSPIRSLALAGVFAGFACGVKLTTVPTLVIPIPLAALIVSAWHGRLANAPAKSVVIGSLVFILTTAIAYSPWLIRTAIATGNPVFPEAQSVLGRAHFSGDQSERWHRAHSRTAAQQPMTARLRAFVDQVLGEWRYGFILLPLALVFSAGSASADRLFIRRARSEASNQSPEAEPPDASAIVFLLLLLAGLTIFWLAFTHLQGRFFVLSIPIAGLLLAHLQRGVILRIAVAMIAIQVIASTIHVGHKFAAQVSLIRDAGALGLEDFSALLPESFVEAMKGPEPIALVGDARPFRYPSPMSRLHYRTVFDIDAKPNQSIIDAWLEGSPSDALLIVDPPELDRFSRTYYAIPPLPEDFQGPRDRSFILYR